MICLDSCEELEKYHIAGIFVGCFFIVIRVYVGR